MTALFDTCGPHRSASRRDRGFTFVEVLVALLLLSIGVMGLARMQLETLKATHAAYQRTIASLAAQDAQERLWLALAEQVEASPDQAAICPNSQLKTMNDSGSDWHQRWKRTLPELKADHIQYTPGEGVNRCRFMITVQWQDNRFPEEASQEGMVPALRYEVRLPSKSE